MIRSLIPSLGVFAALMVSCTPSLTDSPKKSFDLQGAISLTNPDLASRQLQHRFEPLHPDVLDAYRSHGDQMIRVHAFWELVKGDALQTREFINDLDKEIQFSPPQWWRRCLLSIRVSERSHYVAAVQRTPEGEQVTIEDGDDVVQCHAGMAGFAYPLEIRSKSDPDKVLKIHVWAAGRTVLAGVGVHQWELFIHQGKLYVFGAESHGAYVEIFRLSDGEPLLRFCTCYWFNFSEEWARE